MAQDGIVLTESQLQVLEKRRSEKEANGEIETQHPKEELFNIFKACNALTIDDRLLIGFLKFVKNVYNKNHPILNEFKSLGGKTKMPSKPKSGNVKTD